MRRRLILLGGLAAHALATAACPPAGMSRAQLVPLSAAGYEVADNAKRQSLALGLVGCLGDPDPILRDEIAFGALETWIRSGKLERAPLFSTTILDVAGYGARRYFLNVSPKKSPLFQVGLAGVSAMSRPML